MNATPIQGNPHEHSGKTEIPTRDACSNQQVDTVLKVLAYLQAYVLNFHHEDESARPEMDGGTKCAAQVTFMKACNRLDAILDDSERWNLSSHDALYNAVTKNHESAAALHAEQMESLKSIKRPCHHFKPQFTTVQGGIVVAYWGELTDPGSLIMGKGATPEEALADFDKAFHRVAKDQVRFSPEAEEKLRARAEGQPEPQPQPKKKRSRKS